MVGIRNTCSSEEFEAFWPHWRKDNNIKTVVDCEISCPVDTLYQIFFYPGHQFQVILFKYFLFINFILKFK